MKNAAIHSLLDIALNTPRETADVFFNYFPHIECVEVRIFAGGWSNANVLPQFTDTKPAAEAEALLSRVKAFLASINPAESRRKAAQERLENAIAEKEAAEDELESIAAAKMVASIAAPSTWTTESGELIPFQELPAYSVVDEPTRGPWLDSQEAEDHNERSKPL